MKRLVWISLQAARKKLAKKECKYNFEVFGYDFIIDDQFKVWLIEVNTNPCIEESSPILQVLLPRMLDDAFKLTIDKIFPRRNKFGLNDRSIGAPNDRAEGTQNQPKQNMTKSLVIK